MEELDLKELFEMFWNKKIKIILIVAIFGVIGVIYTVMFVTPEYTSWITLVLAGQEKSNSDKETSETITTTDLTLNSKLVATYSELVTSTNVVRQVISNLGISMDEEALKKNIGVTAREGTDVIEISVTDQNPAYAMQIANETAKVFMEQVSEIYNISNIHVVDQAEEPKTPSNVNHLRDVLIFAFVGVIVSVAYVLIANMLDNTVKTREEVERIFKIPVIAEIPLATVEKGGKK